MNSYTSVKISLFSTHFDGDSKTLHHLINSSTVCMDTQNSLVIRFQTNYLEKTELSFGTVLNQRKEHVVKLTSVDLNVLLAVLFGGIFLTEPDNTDRWMGEDYCGDLLVVHFDLGFSSEKSLSEDSSATDGDWSQHKLASYVSDCVDPLDGRVLVLIDPNAAVIIKLEARVLETQQICIRSSSSRNQYLVDDL